MIQNVNLFSALRKFLTDGPSFNGCRRIACGICLLFAAGGAPLAESLPPAPIAIEAIESGGRGAVPATLPGGSITLSLNDPLPVGARLQSVEVERLSAKTQTPEPFALQVIAVNRPSAEARGREEIVVRVPWNLGRGLYRVKAIDTGKAEPRAAYSFYPFRVVSWAWVIVFSLLPLAVTLLLTWLISRSRIDTGANPRQAVLAMLLVEPKTNTYSLSRAQFILWSLVIAWGYVFVFVANGIIKNSWEFPPLEGFPSTFLISLVTLLAAQFTTSIHGSKGAGQLGPVPADLFMHGGVMALERVQQFLWTVIGAGLFLWIVVVGYGEAAQLPAVPDEMLTIMGLSSLGYVGGKVVRKAGPVITQVLADERGLVVRGDGLSEECLVRVDGEPLQGAPEISGAPAANGRVRALLLAYAMLDSLGIKDKKHWNTQAPHRVVLINPDSQRAEWSSSVDR